MVASTARIAMLSDADCKKPHQQPRFLHIAAVSALCVFPFSQATRFPFRIHCAISNHGIAYASCQFLRGPFYLWLQIGSSMRASMTTAVRTAAAAAAAQHSDWSSRSMYRGRWRQCMCDMQIYGADRVWNGMLGHLISMQCTSCRLVPKAWLFPPVKYGNNIGG